MGINASAQIPGLTDDSQAFKQQQQQKPALRLLVEETKHNWHLKTNNTGKKNQGEFHPITVSTGKNKFSGNSSLWMKGFVE